MIDKLDREDRLRLMRFVCSFAWADLDVDAKERALVRKMAKQLGLDREELRDVEAWLKVPPRAEEVDPNSVPRAHRQIFLDAVRAIIAADGKIHLAEMENLTLFEQLLK